MKKLLSIEGGGMKGLVACGILAEIEKRSGKSVSELFDLVGGTSVGGIIALSIAAGNTAADTLNFFTADGQNIFAQSLCNHAIIHESEFKGYYKYDPNPLETALQARMLGKKMLDARMRVLVPAVDRVTKNCIFFKSWDTETNSYLMWQVGRATSAAQSYFPPFPLNNWSFFDGGNGANNPSVCVHAEATKLWGKSEPMRMLFLGCGDVAPNPHITATPGPFDLLEETVQIELACTDSIPDYQIQCYMGDTYSPIQPVGITTALDGAKPSDLSSLNNALSETLEASSSVIDSFF